MITRRQVVVMLAGASALAATPSLGQTAKTLALGSLSGAGANTLDTPVGKAVVAALDGLGYSLGRNFTYSARASQADNSKLPGLIEALKAEGAEILLLFGYPSALAAKAAGMPSIIFAGAGDPVATGLIESWAHPGGVITGISDDATALTVKRLEFLRAFLPSMRRVAMLWNVDDRAMTLRYNTSAAAATAQNIVVQPLGVREPDDFAVAFAEMEREPPDAILMMADALTLLNRKRVFEFAAARKLPAIYESEQLTRDGGLMSYGADFHESVARAAAMIDRIVKGAKPAEIPFEQPTRYHFAINLKTARALGIEPPVTLLALADEVIE